MFSIYSVLFRQAFYLIDSDVQIIQITILKAIYYPMNAELFSLFPGFLNDWNSGDVLDVMFHIQLNKDILVLLWIFANQLFSIPGSEISYIREPRFKRSMIMFFKSRFYPSKSVMAAYNDIFDF